MRRLHRSTMSRLRCRPLYDRTRYFPVCFNNFLPNKQARTDSFKQFQSGQFLKISLIISQVVANSLGFTLSSHSRCILLSQNMLHRCSPVAGSPRHRSPQTRSVPMATRVLRHSAGYGIGPQRLGTPQNRSRGTSVVTGTLRAYLERCCGESCLGVADTGFCPRQLQKGCISTKPALQ